MKVLVAATSLDGSRFVDDDFRRAGATSVVRPTAGENLLAAVAREAPDVVIVDMGRPDRDSLDDIKYVSQNAPRPIVMFVDHDDDDFMEAAIAAGVSSYNVLTAAPPEVKPIVRAAIALFRRHREMEAELRSAQASLRERSLIDQAKRVLMRERRIGEPEAYRWLRRRAMDSGRRISEIAGDIVAGAVASGEQGP